jgi:hypothetical protein
VRISVSAFQGIAADVSENLLVKFFSSPAQCRIMPAVFKIN